MAAKIKAIINPALIMWARDSAGFTVAEAAQKLGIEERHLAAWEDPEVMRGHPFRNCGSWPRCLSGHLLFSICPIRRRTSRSCAIFGGSLRLAYGDTRPHSKWKSERPTSGENLP